ncbi:MAG TPA: M28 family peptidase [Gemmatimonadaceae bacterium]
MRATAAILTVSAALLAAASASRAQTPAAQDPVMSRIQSEAQERSQLYSLAQTLMDSIGPRLVGSREQRRANEWLLSMYRKWGIPARSERYGTWNEWRREIAHIDLIAPRERPLDGILSTWSPGTKGTVEAAVVVDPDVQSPAEFEAWLPRARGKWVLLNFPWPSCRPDSDLKTAMTPESFARMQAERTTAFEAWYTGRRRSGLRGTEKVRRLASAGALGVVTSLVPPPGPQGWGVSKISTTVSDTIPEIGLSCEDYGLVFRLAEHSQGPILRVDARSTLGAEVPAANVIAELRGQEKPDEYVVLSAHLDSWDPASGATDNGTGTVVMMEAMRILRAVYPNPKRTILVGHWNGEEQGFNGSGSFAADHPQVVAGLQALFNQDNGTGRIVRISMEGFTGAGAFFRRWLSRMPADIAREVQVVDPGTPGHGTDHVSFTCRGAPAFNLGSRDWDYVTYTWHTNLDTFDKLVFDDLRHNATLIAMLAYQASEDPQRVPRERAVPTDRRTGRPEMLAPCRPPARSWAESAG